jgi:hypothetical protein
MIKSFSFLLAAVVAAAAVPATRADDERRPAAASARALPATPVKSPACTAPAVRIAALFTPAPLAAASSCDHCDAHRDRAFDRCLSGRVPECVDGGGINETCCVDHAWEAWWICCYP